MYKGEPLQSLHRGLSKAPGRGNLDRGFTLLEVMIGLAIVAGVVVTLIASLNYHLGLSSDNREILTAAIIGREKVEEIGVFGPPDEKSGDFGVDLSGFALTIKETEDKRFESSERIDLKVVWDDREVFFLLYRKK